MKTLRDATLLLLLVAFGLRAAAALIEPLIPALVVIAVMIACLWMALGRPKRRL